jgi:hypothetical protein
LKRASNAVDTASIPTQNRAHENSAIWEKYHGRFALLMLVAVAQVMPPDGAPLPLK